MRKLRLKLRRCRITQDLPFRVVGPKLIWGIMTHWTIRLSRSRIATSSNASQTFRSHACNQVSLSKHETEVGQTSAAALCCAAVGIGAFLLLMYPIRPLAQKHRWHLERFVRAGGCIIFSEFGLCRTRSGEADGNTAPLVREGPN